MNEPPQASTPPNCRLPWWTWVLPFFFFHAGTWLSVSSIVAPGVGVIYLPTAIGTALIHWWGPRVLLPLYLNALLCVPLWELPIKLAPLYALPETLTVLLSWLLFAKWRKGDCAMASRRSTLEMFAYGLLLPELIGGAYLHCQLLLLGNLPHEGFWRAIGVGALSDLLAFFALSTPLFVFLTQWLRERGLALPAPREPIDIHPTQPLSGSNRLLVTLVIGGTLMAVLTNFPIHQFWFLYATPVLAASIFGGFRAAVLALSWLFVLTLFLPGIFQGKLGTNWLTLDNQLESFWDLLVLGLAALITGRTISDYRRENLLRQQTSRTLEMQEKLLASLVENSPAAIFLKDSKGVYQLANRAFEGVVVRQKDDIIGKTDQDLFPKQAADRIQENDNEALRSSSPLKYEEVFLSPFEERRYFIVKFALHDKEGNAFAVCGIATDITELAAAREKLRKSEEFLRIAISSAKTGVWSRDLETGRIEWSDSIAPLLGVPANSFQGTFESFLSLVHPPDRARVENSIKDAVEGGLTDYFVEYRVERPDGSLQWMESRGHIFRDAEGKAVRSVGAVADISQRKRMEEDLTRSQRRLSAIIETAPSLAIQLYDRSGRVLQWNKASETVFGFSAEEVLGKTLDATVFTPEQAEVFRKTLDEIEATGNPVPPTEFSFRRRDGSLGICLSTIFMLEGSNAFACMDIDITQRKRSEEELLRSQRQLSAIIETAPNLAIQLYDRSGRVLKWNKASEAMFGFSAEEAMGKTLDKTIHTSEEAAAFVKILGEIEATGKSIGPAEYTFRRRDGSTGQCLSTTFMLEGSSNFVCMDIDITERKQLEANFLQSQKIESIGRLAGGVAHDFNNLLTSILGYADLLRSQAAPGSDQEKFLRRISEAAQRGGSLTQQLLGYARRQVAQPAVLDLNERVEKASELLKRLIGEDVELVFLPGRALGNVKADPVQIEQVLMNLAVNARDAMPKGGKLTIETSNVALDENYARSHNEVAPGDYVLLAVSDTGTGIQPEVLPKIFDPFFTTKPVGQGTGLGLATCFGIVKQCKGHISVYSEPARGTTFKVYLPRTGGEYLQPASESDQSPDLRGSETILLVEDEVTIREMVTTALTTMGFKVIQASNGVEALELVRDLPDAIDLLVTDVVMPKMGGKDLATELLKIRPGIRVLFTSGYTEDAIVHHGVLDEGIHFLQKPYTPASLGRKILDVLNAKA